MGFFDLLKRFSSKKQEEVKQIKLDQLEAWIDSWSKKKLETTNTELSNIRQRLTEEKKRLTENIEKLKEAELRNPKIPERAKQIMEGNRTAYLQKVTMFLGQFNLPEQFDSILEYCNTFDKNLEQLGKNTIKNYQILLEFFRDEVSPVSANIKHAHDLIEKVKKLVEDAGIHKANEVKNKVKEVQQKIKRKQELENTLKQAKEELQKESKGIEEKENKIKELEEGSAYKNFINLLNEKKVVEQDIQTMEKQSSFSVIEAALKKYERLTLDDKLVRRYLDNPLKALVDDKELKIVEVLDKMKESMIKGELELKEKKQNKILRELEKLSKNYFEGFLSRYNELHKKLQTIKSDIKKVQVVKEIDQLKQKLGQNRIKVQESKDKIKEMTEELEAISIEHAKKNLQKELRDNISEAVIIA